MSLISCCNGPRSQGKAKLINVSVTVFVVVATVVPDTAIVTAML
jgi:hypothetical protein